jgi:hypothetical protein
MKKIPIAELKKEQQSNKRFWTMEESDYLKELIKAGIYSSVIYKKGIFPDRSLAAISNKMKGLRYEKS